MAENKINTDDIKNVALVIGGGILLYNVLPIIKNLFGIVGGVTSGVSTIVSLPQRVLDTARKAANSGANSKDLSAEPTTIPGISVGTIAQYVDKLMLTKSGQVAMRTQPKSNASVVKIYPDKGNVIGYFYSVVGEKLSGKVKVWVSISDGPQGGVIGYVPFNDILNVAAINGIGCCNQCRGGLGYINY